MKIELHDRMGKARGGIFAGLVVYWGYFVIWWHMERIVWYLDI